MNTISVYIFLSLSISLSTRALSLSLSLSLSLCLSLFIYISLSSFFCVSEFLLHLKIVDLVFLTSFHKVRLMCIIGLFVYSEDWALVWQQKAFMHESIFCQMDFLCWLMVVLTHPLAIFRLGECKADTSRCTISPDPFDVCATWQNPQAMLV